MARCLTVAALASCLVFGGGVRAAIPSPAGNGTVHEVGPAVSEISIDGLLDEQAWKQALSFELDFEVRPGENTPPPVRTELRVTYDDRAIYFAFLAHDPQPERIRARLTDRDRAWNDDWVGIVIDTFNDQRRAYELLSNPLGVQIDAINDEVGGNYDDSWNAIWKSAGRITDDGYQVEMGIPFNQIRFQSGSGRQTWGFDAIRSYPRSDRHHIGLFPRDRSKSSYLSQTVKLVGMSGANPGKNLEVVPTVTASRTDARDSLPDGPLEEANSSSELGATVRWGITPNLTLNGTANPDFSQVEADAVQLDVNEQFALFFRETRPFFLEQADFFNTRLGLVHTRTVTDPSVATKLTGKLGRHTFGVFAANDDVTNVIVPGFEGSSGGSFDTENTSIVGRYRWDLGGSSTVGAAVTDRRGAGYSNQVLSFDTLYRLTDSDTLELGVGRSRTEYSDEMRSEFADLNLEPGAITDTALSFRYGHSVRNYWINVSYDDLGKEYRSDTGFRPQVDFSRWVAGGARVWWGEKGQYYNRMAWGGDADRTVTQDGDLIEEELESWFNFNGPGESRFSVNAGRRNRVFDGVEFLHWFGSVDYGRQLTRDWNASISVHYGDWIDFGQTREADRLIVRPRFRFNHGKHLEVQFSHHYETLDVEGGQLFRIHVPEARIVHQFNVRSFLRAIVQYTDIRREDALYDEEVDRESRDVLAQLLFSYKLNAATALFVGYTDGYFGTEDFGLTRTDRTLFFKVGYAWVP